jgi:hypothetical protein
VGCHVEAPVCGLQQEARLVGVRAGRIHQPQDGLLVDPWRRHCDRCRANARERSHFRLLDERVCVALSALLVRHQAAIGRETPQVHTPVGGCVMRTLQQLKAVCLKSAAAS